MSADSLPAHLHDWLQAGSAFRFEGQRIFYRLQQPGAVDEGILLIHGFPTASWDWSRLWPALASETTALVAPDLLGFGFSDKPVGYPYSILRQADMVEALLRRLGWTRVHILAHDYGVSIAQEMLARQIERGSETSYTLCSTCFLNGGLFPEMHRPRPVQRVLASPFGRLLAMAMTRERFARQLDSVFSAQHPPSPQDIDDFWQLLEWNRGRQVMPRLIGYMAERRVMRSRWVGALLHTGVPLRLIDGMADPVSGAHMVERYRELVAHSDVVELHDVGHYPQWEAPGAVAQAYLTFRAQPGACAPRGPTTNS